MLFGETQMRQLANRQRVRRIRQLRDILKSPRRIENTDASFKGILAKPAEVKPGRAGLVL